MQRFAKKLPREDLKKFGREINKILVASDYKHNRVDDPTKMSKSQAEKAKHMVKQFLDKAVEKKKVIDRHKKEKEARKAALTGSSKADTNGKPVETKVEVDAKEESDDEPDAEVDVDDDLIELSPSSPAPETPSVTESSDQLKRKRGDDGEDTPGDESESSKRLKEDVSPPPPPPPPPASSMPEDDMIPEGEDGMDGMIEGEVVVRETREEKERREQEEELMRENEEAMKMEMDGTLQSAEEVKHLHRNGQLNGHEANGHGVNSDNGNECGFEPQTSGLETVPDVARIARVD
jgi:hypothetical protein